jgi:hypothetical protein
MNDSIVIEMTEEEQIAAWRYDELERAGYLRTNAMRLARRQDIDLHKATDLLKSGCDQEVAMQILL